MSLSPYFKSPFTDLTGSVVSHQWFGRCQEIESKAMDCLEAYGLNKGLVKCELLLEDYNECTLRTKQFKRWADLRAERERQIKAGERTPENAYAPPPKMETF